MWVSMQASTLLLLNTAIGAMKLLSSLDTCQRSSTNHHSEILIWQKEGLFRLLNEIHMKLPLANQIASFDAMGNTIIIGLQLTWYGSWRYSFFLLILSYVLGSVVYSDSIDFESDYPNRLQLTRSQSNDHTKKMRWHLDAKTDRWQVLI